ncbi:MAG: PHB depolymerase family esterase [Candidatus Elarobacter sp.]
MNHDVRVGILSALALSASVSVAACSPSGASRVTPPASAPTRVLSAAQAQPAVAQPASIGRLATYNIDPAKVFVAGISSGGFFGVQMHVAHSRTFKGAAIYAGGVYFCADDSVAVALASCGGEGLYTSMLAPSETYLDLQSSLATIDPEERLEGQPVYLWSGTKDTVVNPAAMNDLRAEYAHYGAQIRYDNAFPAEHGRESPDGELACGTLGSPFMVRCDRGAASSVAAGAGAYDSQQTWLKMFLGRLEPRREGSLRGRLVNFDQTEFGAAASNSMDTNGYAFVPRACADGARCALVLALHGCLQTQADIGTKFITQSGIDAWADTNRIIVLYPYTVKSMALPVNPQGCWDWWGYDDPQYALKSGTQVSIVYKMIERVTGRR